MWLKALHTWVKDMSPYKASASVLGIGVADIARTWGAIYISPFEEALESIAASLELTEVKYNCKILQLQSVYNIKIHTRKSQVTSITVLE